MSRRTTSGRASGRRKSSRSPSSSPKVRGALIGIAVLLFAAGLYFGIQLGKPPPPPDFAALNGAADADAPPDARPGGEGTDRRQAPPPHGSASDPAADATSTPAATVDRPATTPAPPTDGVTRIALVIDDLGRSLRDIDTLGHLGIPITYAVLPFESQTAAVVAKLRQRGEEILCHLPMEAKGGNNPGPGALLSSMSGDELRAATRQAIAAVPGAVGVNNHMGSSIASDPRAIEAVLSEVASSRLYFLDSRTSADTLAFTTARQLGVPAGERQVFLDSDRDPAAIEAQFDRLLQLAKQRGQAIAIAHPYAETLAVLAQRVPQATAEGIRFVPASTLLDR